MKLYFSKNVNRLLYLAKDTDEDHYFWGTNPFNGLIITGAILVRDYNTTNMYKEWLYIFEGLK